MPVEALECWGMFKPGDFDHLRHSPPPTITVATESKPMTPSPAITTVPESKSMTTEYEGFQVTEPSWESWSPARVRAANAEYSAWQLAGQKADAEEAAAAAALVKGPEPGATYTDIRVYTRLKSKKYKYWGVRDNDMTMEEFWIRNDPENTREEDNIQNARIDPVPAQIGSLSNSPSPRSSAAPSPRRSRKTPDVISKHRVRKSENVTPPVNTSTRNSLGTGTKLDARLPGLNEQTRTITNSTPDGRRSVAHPAAVEGLYREAKDLGKRGEATKTTLTQPPNKPAVRGRPRKVQPDDFGSIGPKAADQRMSKPNDPRLSSPPKRKRGRPAKAKSSTESSGKQKRPAAENKAKITKPMQKKERSSAPSSHKMRTRGRGPAEHLQIT